MISVSEALGRILDLTGAIGSEQIPLADAMDRVLVADAYAGHDQPPFSASAMDGYAVRAGEALTGRALPVIGESAAGAGLPAALPAGSAMRIFTGAAVPEGADTILIQEDTARDGDQIVVRAAPQPGGYLRPRGMDFAKGDAVSAPRRLSSRDLSLLAAMNVPYVTVSRRPVVALIPTGDELVMPGALLDPGQIVSSNNFGLAGMISSAGGQPLHCPIARDNRESLIAALDFAKDADLIVTLGGASVGDHDLVAEVLGSQGLSLDFYKVAMRPGKPLMAGRLGNATMIGLPGNPVSALVCGEIFLRPAIDKALGLPSGARSTKIARLACGIGANGPREHYMRAVVTEGPEGPICDPAKRQDSNLVATLARSNALMVRAPHAEPAEAGAKVHYIELD